jgi:phage terminase large subunit
LRIVWSDLSLSKRSADWSSHAADALGLTAIRYEEPGRAGNFNRTIRYREQGWV